MATALKLLFVFMKISSIAADNAYVYRGANRDICGNPHNVCLSNEVCIGISCTKITDLADDCQRLQINSEDEIAILFSVWKVDILRGFAWKNHQQFKHAIPRYQMKWDDQHSGCLFRVFSSDGAQSLVSLEGIDNSFPHHLSLIHI